MPYDSVAQCEMTLKCCVGRCIAFVSLEITNVSAAVPHTIYFRTSSFLSEFFFIQYVPLATEPGISLIILTPMKILQRNLNRSTFVV